MARVGFQWTDGSASELAAVIARFASVVPDIALDVASSEASRAEAWMKEKAPWKDRTANARKGLFSKAEKQGNVIYMYFGGTEEYFPYLELGTRKMKPYRVAIPAFDRWRQVLPDQVGKQLMMFVP